MSPEPAAAAFHSEPISHCRICGGANLTDYLDLGAQPPSNSFIAPDRIPMSLRFCRLHAASFALQYGDNGVGNRFAGAGGSRVGDEEHPSH